jgi:hypothetical protein
VKKNITDKVAGWSWEIDQEEKCPVMNKKNVVVGTQTSVRGMECIATLQDLMEKQIVDVIDFEELEATVIGIILKTQEMGDGVTGMLEKETAMMRIGT